MCRKDGDASGGLLRWPGNMKALLFIVVTLLLVALSFTVHAHQNRDSSGTSADPKVYVDLRNMVLQGSRAKFGLPPASKPTEPYGVLMDWGIGSSTATVVAVADGTASVYLSSGGGFIGGSQSHESLRAAAKRTVKLSSEVQPLMHVTTTYPLPQRGHVTFYVLTDAGVFTATASEEDMKTHRSPLHKLGDSHQAITTEYRMMQQDN